MINCQQNPFIKSLVAAWNRNFQQSASDVANVSNDILVAIDTNQNKNVPSNGQKSDEEGKLYNFVNHQAQYRRQMLRKYLQPHNITNYGEIHNGIVPEVICPRLARVGSVADGGKWTCNPWALPENCTIYSFGVNVDISFETELDDIANKRCHILAFDAVASYGARIQALSLRRFTFEQIRLASNTNSTERTFTLSDLMRMHGHEFIDFLKIDIEGGEHEVLPDFFATRSDQRAIICQIFVEMHGNPTQYAVLHESLSLAGFYLFAREINGHFLHISEYSFIHQSCFQRYGVSSILGRNFI